MITLGGLIEKLTSIFSSFAAGNMVQFIIKILLPQFPRKSVPNYY